MSNQARFSSFHNHRVVNRSNRNVGNVVSTGGEQRQKHTSREARMMAAAARYNHYMATSSTGNINSINNPFLGTMNKVRIRNLYCTAILGGLVAFSFRRSCCSHYDLTVLLAVLLYCPRRGHPSLSSLPPAGPVFLGYYNYY